MMNLIIVFHFIFLFVGQSWANEFRYADFLKSTVKIEDHDKLLIPYKDGELLIELHSLLGAGNTTNVLDATFKNKRVALRLPKSNGQFNTYSAYVDFLENYYQGQMILEMQGVSVPKIFHYEKDKYIIVEKLSINSGPDLETLFLKKETLDENIYVRAVARLDDFARELAPFSLIKDFHLKQARYSLEEDKWYLLDWMDSHELFTDIEDSVALEKRTVEQKYEELAQAMNSDSESLDLKNHDMPDDANRLLNNLKKIITEERKIILETENEFLTEKLQKIESAKSVEEFIDLITSPAPRFSRHYVETILDIVIEQSRFDRLKILEKIPFYLISDNQDYLRLVTELTQKEMTIHELAELLSLKKVRIMNINWELTMRIQKLITDNQNILSAADYEILIKHPFVTNYAKNWIEKNSSCYTKMGHHFSR
ncbi:hypothetical protein M899_0508 [Bacteriovorax sp. BSW11_IV]|uniref:hypothetical protein n=1 Tax=Bacteriovorax sp. BSW11_IV TaxID=1353529 RepID=UPI000389E4BB|nr:hypothetical protein [Bacteriovorax sp. BSW11_IV]EQC44941.1 hypothetical protein M899_0508 [Bacteriovorax sp. BSW11_IV]